MDFFNRRSLGWGLSLGMLVLIGCAAESKITQCNRLAELVNRLQAVQPPQSPEEIAVLATTFEGLRRDLQVIALQDSQLKTLQEQLSTLYTDVAVALRLRLKSAEAINAESQEKVAAELARLTAEEEKFITAMNKFCRE
jgi:hypothetical protein